MQHLEVEVETLHNILSLASSSLLGKSQTLSKLSSLVEQLLQACCARFMALLDEVHLLQAPCFWAEIFTRSPQSLWPSAQPTAKQRQPTHA